MRSRATRFDSDQPKRAFSCRYFKHEQRDERRPDLNLQGIGGGPDKRFHPQILFQRLEKQFDLPPVLVKSARWWTRRASDDWSGTRGGLRRACATTDPPEQIGIFPARYGAPESNPSDRTALPRCWAARCARRRCSRHSASVASRRTPARPSAPRTRRSRCTPCRSTTMVPGSKLLLPRHRSLAVLAVCDHQERRQIPVLIECEMQLHRTFGTPKHRPRKHLRAQVDDRRIETEQFVFEPERLRARDLPTPRQDLVEHALDTAATGDAHWRTPASPGSGPSRPDAPACPRNSPSRRRSRAANARAPVARTASRRIGPST